MIELPGYQLIRELGSGGMAHVYLALHTRLDRHVAIKVMYSKFSNDSSYSDRFLREARISANLNHSNIITVFDVGMHDGHHYIAMEYLSGESLGDKMTSGLTLKDSLSFIKQIAKGLAYAHAKGFIHRDIKPENILFREDGTAVITDFGIARAEESETQMTQVGTLIGTPHYMSPEQAQGLAIKSNSDLYSLGVVFYEMLTGDVPYRAESTVGVIYKHVHEPIPKLVAELTIYQTILENFLAKDPQERFQTGDEIICNIEALDLDRNLLEISRDIPSKKSAEIHQDDSTLINVKPQNKQPAVDIKWGAPLATSLLLIIAVVGGYLFTGDSGQPNALVEVEKISNKIKPAKLKQLEIKQTKPKGTQQAKPKQEKNVRVEVVRVQAERENIARKKEGHKKIKTAKIVRTKKVVVQEGLPVAMQTRKNQHQKTEKNITTLLASAESFLRKNNINDAFNIYQQVLNIDAENKMAKDGVYKIADKYLVIAEHQAMALNFTEADKYIHIVRKISPNHPWLPITQQMITSIKAKKGKK